MTATESLFFGRLNEFYNKIGTKRTYRHAATMSALEEPDDICSLRAFPVLTPTGH